MNKKPSVVHMDDDYRIVVKKVLSISDDLDSEFRRQAMLYGRVSRFHAEAKKAVREVENQMEIVKSRLRKFITARAISRLTKDDIQAKLVMKKSYRRKLEELNDAIYHENLMGGLLKAVDQRKDMLVGLGANYRHDGGGGELTMLKKELRDRTRRRNYENE